MELSELFGKSVGQQLEPDLFVQLQGLLQNQTIAQKIRMGVNDILFIEKILNSSTIRVQIKRNIGEEKGPAFMVRKSSEGISVWLHDRREGNSTAPYDGPNRRISEI